MTPEKSPQQHINDKQSSINKRTMESGDTVCVTVTIDRLNLRAKNYAKQDKVVMVIENSGETAISCGAGLEPYVNLLARICENAMDEAAEVFVS